ncbi:hypothetical protein [Roseiconus lacunae]|uniref:hypothetical protein n=1 Tax=Roseiconus lacunae TaxID=2605694 RepID=UPI0011F2A36A|nr:hypothetical protein [Roseiconus lacunae]
MERRIFSVFGMMFLVLFTFQAAMACERCGTPKKCTGQCQAKTGRNALPTPMRRSSLLQQLRPNRILIVTCQDRQDRLHEQSELMRSLANHLRNQSAIEVIECPHRSCLHHFPIQTGRFSEHQLIDLGKRYSADTIIYCEVANIDSYRPMKMELRFLMVSTHQAIALASASRNHDLGHPATRKQFLGTFDPYEHSGETLLRSPSRLIDYSAQQLAAELLRL